MTNNSYANECIVCTVTSCKHHNNTENYCALDEITVDTLEKQPTDCACTNCRSFEPKNLAD